METIDEEVTAQGARFHAARAKAANKPFFLWWNSTRMHICTHLKARVRGTTGLGIYADGMVEHDGHVGQLLAKLKELGLDQQHDRDVLDRQRCRTRYLARRRHDACSAARRTPTGKAATVCPP